MSKDWVGAALVACLIGWLTPSTSHAAGSSGCSNRIIGDSLAEGVVRYVRPGGFKGSYSRGQGIDWFGAMQVECTRKLVLILGTNDVAGIDSEVAAGAYASRVLRAVDGWKPKAVVWVLPGCFDAGKRPEMERGSELLDGALKFGISNAPMPIWIVRTRVADCTIPEGDGIHRDADGYARLWQAVVLGR